MSLIFDAKIGFVNLLVTSNYIVATCSIRQICSFLSLSDASVESRD